MPGFTPPAQDPALGGEQIPLHLPSSLTSKERDRVCRPGLTGAEQLIRLASLGDALADLTRHLRTRTVLLRFRAKQAPGVRQGTRLRDSAAGVSRRIDAAAAGYRRHRAAYKKLAGLGEWEKTYRPLSARDVRGLSEKAVSDHELRERYRAKEITEALAHVLRHGYAPPAKPAAAVPLEDDSDDDEDGDMAHIDALAPHAKAARDLLAEEVAPGEGRRKLSWIWMSGLQVDDVVDNDLTDGWFLLTASHTVADSYSTGLRVEWGRTRARCDRWKEEVMLTSEEMRRNLAYAIYERKRWLELAMSSKDCRNGTRCNDLVPPIAIPPLPDCALDEGRRAYCLERALDEEVRVRQLVAKWRPIHDDLKKKNPFISLLLIDPAFDAALAAIHTTTDQSTASATRTSTTESRAAAKQQDDNTQALVMELAEGLAMATLDCEGEPRCVALPFRRCSPLMSASAGPE
jgi:hypothetical protein